MILQPSHPNEKITDLIKKLDGKKLISIEVDPYKNVDFNAITEISPNFCSVAWVVRKYEETDEIKHLEPIKISKELIRLRYTVLLHLPCVYFTTAQLRRTLEYLKSIGIRNIFVRRAGKSRLKIESTDFPYAVSCLRFIKNEFGDHFDLGVAGFPQVHPTVNNMEENIFLTREKVLAGADLIVTHACFSPKKWAEFKENCVKFAIDVPIIAGVMTMRCLNDFLSIKRTSSTVDDNVMGSALKAKHMQRTLNFCRNFTKDMMLEVLKLDGCVGVHVFSKNNFELVKNLLKEIDAGLYKADFRKCH